MAGNYLDVPNARIAYDRNGTQFYALQTDYSAVFKTLTTAQAQAMNSEAGSGVDGRGAYGAIGYLLYFPVKMDITHHFIATDGTIGTPQVSADTTNGIDGTWTAITPTNRTFSKPNARQQITALSGATGIIAMRWVVNVGAAYSPIVHALHLYGTPSAVNDRLEFWHPTLDQPLSQTPAWLDWGNRPQGTSATKQFRIKNRSTSLTASTITVGMEALTDASPTYVSQHTFALGAGAAAATVTIPSLAPAAISDVITVNQSLSSTAVLSLWWQRMYANAGSWA